MRMNSQLMFSDSFCTYLSNLIHHICHKGYSNSFRIALYGLCKYCKYTKRLAVFIFHKNMLHNNTDSLHICGCYVNSESLLHKTDVMKNIMHDRILAVGLGLSF